MVKKNTLNKKPLVGFFPLFYNLAETGRAVLIAKRYIELGGGAVFFSHGGRYEYLTKDIGCQVVRVNPIYTEEFIDHLWKCSRLEDLKPPFSKEVLLEHIEAETAAYKKTGVKMIVSTNNFPCSISARVAKIPLIGVTPKAFPYFTKYPDDAEFFFTKILPNSCKLKALNYFAPRTRGWSRPFEKVAKKYPDIPNLRGVGSLTKGDHTFYTDFLEILKLDKSEIPSDEHYIGPIFLDELFEKSFSNEKSSKEKNEIKKHLQRPGRSILLSLGSSGTKEIFLNILKTLNKTDFNVIAVYTSILDENDLPEFNDNILLKKFVPSIKEINESVDLAILHGGQGTIYTAAYSGKPVIGFPMQFEQHLNLEMLVKHGMAIILSRKNFKEEKLLNAINSIIDKYSAYLDNAQALSKKLPKPEGDKNAVNLIIKILKKEN